METAVRYINEIPIDFQRVFQEYPCFNTVQSTVLNEVLHTDNSIVVSAPTGSGKTAIFEMAIIRVLNKNKEALSDTKMIYISPIKALCRERLIDWHKKFSEYGVKCISLTSDTDDMETKNISNYNLIISTPEKWDVVTRRWRDNQKIIETINIFMIDEVHLLNADSRGSTLEVIVSRIKTAEDLLMFNKSKNKIRFIALSATVPNVEDIAKWLEPSGAAKYFKFSNDVRPVKLKKLVYGFNPTTKTSFKFDLSLNYKLPNLISKYSEGKPTLIFCSTRKSVEMTTSHLVSHLQIRLSPEQKKVLCDISKNISEVKLKQFITHGIAMHHAGLVLENRNVIENTFREGHLPILVATSTLAMGVNLPAHLVIIKGTKRYQPQEGFKDYDEVAIFQMIGRAGRSQFDTSATALILTTLQDQSKFEKMLDCTQNIESNLHKHLTEHLNAEIVLRTITDLEVAMRWLSSTFLYVRALKSPEKYKLPVGLSKEKIDKKLLEICQIDLNKLVRAGMIRINQAIEMAPTVIGEIMAKYYVAFQTMELFTKVSGNEIITQILSLLSKSHEFSEIYLRSTDKKCLNLLNKNLRKESIRFPHDGRIKTVDMKINCIIQAILGNLEISDQSILNDSVRVMRNCERLAKCLIEYLETRIKCHTALLSTITLAKCFHAKLWENSPYVSKQLTGVGRVISTLLVKAGKTTFKEIINTNPRHLETIVGRKAPFGSCLVEEASHLPEYNVRAHLRGNEIELTLELLNRCSVEEKSTINVESCMILLVGDSEENVLLYEKYSHSYMLDNPKVIRSISIENSDLSFIVANLISENWVGIDSNLKLEIPVDCINKNSASEKTKQNKTKQTFMDMYMKNVKKDGLNNKKTGSNRTYKENENVVSNAGTTFMSPDNDEKSSLNIDLSNIDELDNSIGADRSCQILRENNLNSLDSDQQHLTRPRDNIRTFKNVMRTKPPKILVSKSIYHIPYKNKASKKSKKPSCSESVDIEDVENHPPTVQNMSVLIDSRKREETGETDDKLFEEEDNIKECKTDDGDYDVFKKRKEKMNTKSRNDRCVNEVSESIYSNKAPKKFADIADVENHSSTIQNLHFLKNYRKEEKRGRTADNLYKEEDKINQRKDDDVCHEVIEKRRDINTNSQKDLCGIEVSKYMYRIPYNIIKASKRLEKKSIPEFVDITDVENYSTTRQNTSFLIDSSETEETFHPVDRLCVEKDRINQCKVDDQNYDFDKRKETFKKNSQKNLCLKHSSNASDDIDDCYQYETLMNKIFDDYERGQIVIADKQVEPNQIILENKTTDKNNDNVTFKSSSICNNIRSLGTAKSDMNISNEIFPLESRNESPLNISKNKENSIRHRLNSKPSTDENNFNYNAYNFQHPQRVVSHYNDDINSKLKNIPKSNFEENYSLRENCSNVVRSNSTAEKFILEEIAGSQLFSALYNKYNANDSPMDENIAGSNGPTSCLEKMKYPNDMNGNNTESKPASFSSSCPKKLKRDGSSPLKGSQTKSIKWRSPLIESPRGKFSPNLGHFHFQRNDVPSRENSRESNVMDFGSHDISGSSKLNLSENSQKTSHDAYFSSRKKLRLPLSDQDYMNKDDHVNEDIKQLQDICDMEYFGLANRHLNQQKEADKKSHRFTSLAGEYYNQLLSSSQHKNVNNTTISDDSIGKVENSEGVKSGDISEVIVLEDTNEDACNRSHDILKMSSQAYKHMNDIHELSGIKHIQNHEKNANLEKFKPCHIDNGCSNIACNNDTTFRQTHQMMLGSKINSAHQQHCDNYPKTNEVTQSDQINFENSNYYDNGYYQHHPSFGYGQSGPHYNGNIMNLRQSQPIHHFSPDYFETRYGYPSTYGNFDFHRGISLGDSQLRGHHHFDYIGEAGPRYNQIIHSQMRRVPEHIYSQQTNRPTLPCSHKSQNILQQPDRNNLVRCDQELNQLERNFNCQHNQFDPHYQRQSCCLQQTTPSDGNDRTFDQINNYSATVNNESSYIDVNDNNYFNRCKSVAFPKNLKQIFAPTPRRKLVHDTPKIHPPIISRPSNLFTQSNLKHKNVECNSFEERLDNVILPLNDSFSSSINPDMQHVNFNALSGYPKENQCDMNRFFCSNSKFYKQN